MWLRRARLLTTVLALVVSGCAQAGYGLPSAAASGRAPDGAEPSGMTDYAATDPRPTAVGPPHVLGGSCVASYSPDRCQAMAFAAAHQLGASFAEVLTVDAVPNPSPVFPDFGHRVFLDVTVAGRAAQAVVIACPGIASAGVPECMNEPTVPLTWPQPLIDLPGDATPFPPIDPAVRPAGVPLRAATLVVPVSRLGMQTVELGQATLPNGVLTEASFGLADPWPASVLFNGSIQLVAKPVGGGPAFTNQWEHGWHPGVEAFQLSLAFDVAWFEPGASFTIVNLVVR